MCGIWVAELYSHRSRLCTYMHTEGIPPPHFQSIRWYFISNQLQEDKIISLFMSLPPASKGRWEVMFSQVCVCSTLRRGGMLPDREYPILPNRGYSHPRSRSPHPGKVPGQDRGTLNWNSIACTCYTAGGMPLAFTQDFLVKKFICIKA